MGKAKVATTGEVYGIEFYVDPTDFQFVVPSIDKKFDGYGAMCRSIEASAEKIKKAKRRTLDLNACGIKDHWSDDLEVIAFRVVGVHAGNGHIVTEPRIDNRDLPYRIFPATARASGFQTWIVNATDSDDAIARYDRGEGEFEDNEVEVTALGEPEASEV
jgi:hypothetical protein